MVFSGKLETAVTDVMMYEVRKRGENGFVDRWGIYDLRGGAWVEIHFATKIEAEQAVALLTNIKPTLGKKKPRY